MNSAPDVRRGVGTRLRRGCACLAFCLLAACSHEQVYNAVQQNRQQECARLPQVQYEKCMSEVDTPYRDYERERQEIMRDTE